MKWVDPDSMHITLLFLGEVSELDLVPICRIVNKCAGEIPPFSMEFKGLGAFPTPRRPKILWSGISEGMESLQLLHERLEEPLLEQGHYRREGRAYQPHLTLGRLNAEAREGEWGPILAANADWEGGTTRVEEVLVMRSDQRRDGPVYSVIGRGKLKGIPAEEEDEDED